MVDYSRFDHIDSGSDDDTPEPRAHGAATNSNTHSTGATSDEIPNESPKSPPGKEGSRGSTDDVGDRGAGSVGVPDDASFAQPRMLQASKKGKEGRISFEYQGRTVYEWEQSVDEVNLYIQPPPGLKASQVECIITPKHLRLGIKGNPPFIDEDTGGSVVVEESYWMMEGGELNVNLQKMKKAETWPGALQGRNASVDPVTLEEMQKKIMLERFQNENPGFDFSGAEFNGQVPDPRTFMGGVKYA